jgi:hypothetical protein
MSWKVWGLNSGRGKKFFSSPERPDTFWGPPSRGYRDSSPRVKWLGHEVYHSPSTRVKVKNGWRYIRTPPIYLHGVERENFTFYKIRATRFLGSIHNLVCRTEHRILESRCFNQRRNSGAMPTSHVWYGKPVSITGLIGWRRIPLANRPNWVDASSALCLWMQRNTVYKMLWFYYDVNNQST